MYIAQESNIFDTYFADLCQRNLNVLITGTCIVQNDYFHIVLKFIVNMLNMSIRNGA